MQGETIPDARERDSARSPAVETAAALRTGPHDARGAGRHLTSDPVIGSPMPIHALTPLFLALTVGAADAATPDAADAPTTAYQRGIEQLKAGDAAAAFRTLTSVVEAEPTNADAWWELGWACWARDDFAGAHAAWLEVATLDPKRADLARWQAAARTRLRYARDVFVSDDVPLQPVGPRLTLAAAGDTMMGTAVRKGAAGLAAGNGEDLFTGVDAWMRAADIAFLNLEGPLADDHLPTTKCRPGSTSCYAFRTPTRYVRALVDMGVDVASLANNHAMDVGDAGMQSTMDTLDSAGIAHAGKYGDVALLERDGVTVGFLAAHSGSCCLNVNRLGEITQAVAELDAKADIVVLSFHGGAEGAAHRHVPGRTEVAWGEQRGDVEKLAHAAIDAGADVVLGHGPHVLRAMEVYRERLIVYSLGNFSGYNQFGTKGGFGGTSMVVELQVASNGVLTQARLHPVALDSLSRPRPDPTGAAIEQVQELSDADFPESGVRIGADGVISWRSATEPG